MQQSKLYYESHITVEPVFGEKLDQGLSYKDFYNMNKQIMPNVHVLNTLRNRVRK